MERELLFSPREQPFYNYMRKVSVLIGQYRTRDDASRRARFSRNIVRVLYVIYTTLISTYIMYAFNHTDESIYNKGLYYTTVLIHITLVLRQVMSQTDIYQEQYTKYMDELHLSNFEYHDEETTQILYNTDRMCYMLYLALRVCIVLSSLSFAFTPALLSWLEGAFAEGSNVELQSALYMSLPFDYKHSVRNWILYSIFVACQSTLLGYILVYYDQFMLCVAFHILGRIKVCIHNVHSLHSDDVVLTPEDDERMFVELKIIIDHHNLILVSLERLKNAFGLVMFGNYTYNAIGCCLLLLLISSNWPLSGLKYGTFAVTVLCFLVGETIVIESISTAMSNLHKEIYTVPWTAMSQRNQKTVYIMLLVSQKEFVFKALGVTNINLKAMASILKASLSYFIWLQTTTD